ncbi:MAG TPA: hypothetical protein VG759_20495 [Candidatus Angelobacter sp.]|nr:hypothetical protein [Candidatus Angelobacter sp.]
MKKFIFAIAAVLSTHAFAQQYGVTNYKVNGQAVASQYNYSMPGPTTLAAGAGTISFNPNFCSVVIGTGRTFNPWSASASIKIVDTANSANTETVTPSSVVVNGSQCNITATFANAHGAGAYLIRSGTCGLKEALIDLGSSGTALVTQEFYDQGCSGSTITSVTGGAAGNFVIDISNGKYDVYGWNTVTTAFAKIGSFGNMSFAPVLTLQGTCTGTATASSTLGLYQLGELAATTCTSTTVNIGQVMNRAGTLLNLQVTAGTGGVNASSGVFTVLKNGSAATLTCTAGTATSCSDVTHTAAFAVGDVISIQFTTQAAETLAGIKASVTAQ